MSLLFALFWVGVAALLPIAVLVSLVKVSRALAELRELRARVDALAARPLPPAPPPPAPSEAVAEPPRPVPALPPRAPIPPRAVPDTPPRPTPFGQPAPRDVATSMPAIDLRDFATNLGPKILVVAGGLAVVTFLSLFVRYAWENDWVGPLGRVLSASVFSGGLVAVGLRIMERRYRPLGQGLAAAGLAGLYVTAWAAHEVYGLLSRETAGLLLVAVAVAAAILALRRDARLVAGLASVGGYLAPVLVSTGEDHGEILFAYLVLLGAGAAWLERRKPWREALWFGAVGSLLLYAGWFESHFSARRFGVAAVGLVALTALYAFGKARADGGARLLAGLVVFASGSQAVSVAAAPESAWGPLLLLAALAQIALLASERWSWTPVVGAAFAAIAVGSWYGHFGATSTDRQALALGLGTAAAYLGPLAAGAAGSRAIGVPGALAHVVASLLALGMLNGVLSDRPGPLFLATLGLAAVHLLLGLAVRGRDFDPLRARVALGLAALLLTVAIPVWFGLHATTLAWSAQGGLLLWLGVRERSLLARASGYAVLLLAVIRLFARHVPLHTEAFTPVLNPVFGTWLAVVAALVVARRLVRGLQSGEGAAWLDGRFAVLVGPLAVALLLGLLTAETRSWFDVAVESARDAGDLDGARRADRQGGLAVTTLWAAFATALLYAGRRSPPARAAGYALLLADVARLLLAHTPLHPDPFTPLVNPAFATWALVILALGLAGRVARRLSEPERAAWFDAHCGRLLGPLALCLLFGVLTAETQSAFAQLERHARALGDAEGALRAERAGDVALSVLWTLFATALLSAGIAVRSLPLFYSAYGIFAFTAAKVVLVDLATLPTLYRMFSFLALGALLLAGAWLNLRFRERLARVVGSIP